MLLTLLLSAFAAEDFDPRATPGPWENHTVTVSSGLDIHYLAAGPADAPTVVLLHGFPDFSYGWRVVLPELARDHRVLAPDLRGFAGTGRAEDYAIDRLVDDLEGFLDATTGVGHAPVHLIGHDWGAYVTWQAVARTPERYGTATVLSVAHPVAMGKLLESSRAQRRYLGFVRTMRTPFTAPYLAGLSEPARRRVFFERELVDDSVLSAEDMHRYNAVFDDPAEIAVPVAYYRALRLPTRRKPPAPLRVTTPTLVLWGADDHYMLAELAGASCALVEARCAFEVYPGAGHFLHWDKPAEVVERWRRFVYGGG